MGTVVAQDIFQSKLDSIFIGMEGVTGIADDMVIARRDEMEHDRNFLAFMEKCMNNNLTRNLEKIQFKQSLVSFYGHCWSKHRISPDPKNIQALNHMEFPPDKETMRSFLGMINYLNRYRALSAHLAAPLSALTHQAVDIPFVDALSCVTPMDPEDNIKLPIIAVNMITTRILMSAESQGSFSNKLDRLRKSTAQDEQLTRLKGYISTGFLCDKKNLPTDLQEFWPHKEMLSIESGLITCGNRIIVPREMRPEMLQYIHKGHQGKERCLLRARNTVFWPKMAHDVQQLTEKSIICQEYKKSQPIIGTTQELPPFPWHTLATDMFYWKRMDFLIVVDVFSKYIIVRKLPNSTSAAMCIGLSMIVTELGLPHIITSENGPCYNSKEFQ